MNPIESHVFAFYAAGAARDFNPAPRWYPHGELVLIVEDKIQVVTRKFGRVVTSKIKPVAAAFVDHMVAKGAWSSKDNDYGGTMHQFQPDAYKLALAEITANNPIIQEASTADAEFWVNRFADLTAA
jgi:hypothetical protein